jgi:hypothetical protein
MGPMKNKAERLRKLWNATILGIACVAAACAVGAALDLPGAGTIRFVLSPALALTISVAIVTGFYQTRKISTAGRLVVTAFYVCAAVAATEAATFHVGPQSHQWLVLTIAPLILGAAVLFILDRQSFTTSS